MEVGQGKVRRVVTGHDGNGRAIVVMDSQPIVRTNPLRAGHYSVDVWRTDGAPAAVGNRPDPTTGPRQIRPHKNGTVIRIADIGPETDAIRNLDPEKVKELFRQMGHEQASTYGKNRRHPLMHRTETVDYAVVLSGEITMLLDNSEIELKTGDIVVQVGTNHAWSNRSGKPCRMLFVLIDGKFDPELAEKFKSEAH